MSTVFSPTQERLFLQMFQLLATKAAPGIYDSILKLEMPTDTVFSSLVNYSLASGTILQAIKHFIGADFVKNQQDKSFLRDGSFASKIVCKFLAISGKPFFQDVLGDFINQIINEDKSWDESKKKHQETIQEKMKILLNVILSPRVQENCPYPMKFIAHCIAENTKSVPDSKLNSLGTFFWNQCFANALSSEEYGLIGTSSKKVKKNFTIIAEILQCFANRTTFDKKNPLNFLNGFITANQDRMDQFVQTLSLPVKQLPEVAIPIEFSVTDYQMMEKLLTNVNVVVSLLKAPDVEPFTKLAQELQFYRALESLNVDQLNDGQTVKLKVVLETSDHAYETELEGPGSVVGSLVPGFLKTLEAAKKKIGKREKTSSLHPATSKVFGTALSDVLLTQSTTNPLALASGSLSMPKFIEAVIQELFLRGMESEGIFRLTGSTPKVQELKEYINKGDVPDFSTEDVNNLASLIKLYFKELPEPLVTDQKYESFMNVADLTEDKVAEELSRLFSQIPAENKLFSFKLLRLLHQISLNSSINKMTPENLGIAFGPSFFFQKNSDIADVQRPIIVFKKIIVHFETIFKDLIESSKTGDLTFKRKLIIPESVRELTVIDKDQLIAGYSRTKLRIWNAADYSLKGEIEMDSSVLAILAIDCNIWISTEKSISIIDPRELKILNTIEQPASSMAVVGSSIWASYALKKTIVIIDPENPTNVTEIESPEELCAISCFGNQVWTGTLSSSIIVWDSQTFKPIHTIPNAHKRKINSFTSLPNKRIASCSDDGSIAVWSETFDLVNKIDAHSAKIRKIRLFDSSKKTQTQNIVKRAAPPNPQNAPNTAVPGPSVPPPSPGRRAPIPVGRGVVANLQRNIVIPVPGSAPPIKRPSVNPNPNPNPNPNSNPTSSFLVSSNPVVQDLFSCSWDKTIKKWNAQNFNLKEQIGGYFSDEVSDFVFLYNTKINCWTMIATGGGLDHSLVFWEMPKTL